MSTLLLVDGHAYAYRAFHAIRSLSGPDGRATNAIFGFVKMLSRMRGLLSPEYLVVIWDGGLSPERMELVPEYKAHRPSMPEELERQIEEIGEYLQAEGVPSLQQEGVEADDLIASLARLAVGRGERVVIASSDKDFFQLVSPQIGMLNPSDKSDAIWTPEKVREKTGVHPEQIVDWLSLIGDAVDNICGVAGVGPKTAADLLGRFGSVESLYQRLPEVKSERLREALQAAADTVRRNQRMIRLKDDLPGLEPDVLAVKARDHVKLGELFRRWGFKGLAAELENAKERQADFFGK